jgi:hypothetical protein
MLLLPTALASAAKIAGCRQRRISGQIDEINRVHFFSKTCEWKMASATFT